VWETPPGMLASERAAEGTYVPEVVVVKTKDRARGRMRVGGVCVVGGCCCWACVREGTAGCRSGWVSALAVGLKRDGGGGAAAVIAALHFSTQAAICLA
jgi:hypothetical protein